MNIGRGNHFSCNLSTSCISLFLFYIRNKNYIWQNTCHPKWFGLWTINQKQKVQSCSSDTCRPSEKNKKSKKQCQQHWNKYSKKCYSNKIIGGTLFGITYSYFCQQTKWQAHRIEWRRNVSVCVCRYIDQSLNWCNEK